MPVGIVLRSRGRTLMIKIGNFGGQNPPVSKIGAPKVLIFCTIQCKISASRSQNSAGSTGIHFTLGQMERVSLSLEGISPVLPVTPVSPVIPVSPVLPVSPGVHMSKN